MSESELKYFQMLKNDISQEVRKSFPGNSDIIENWKGVEISNFQEDLGRKVNGRISEKWFYTHIKSKKESLPRVDILDLLSQYIGYENWSDYKSSQSAKPKSKPRVKALKPIVLVSSVLIVLIVLVVNLTIFSSSINYEFCFTNAYSKQPVAGNELEVWVLSIGESPYLLKTNDSGCFQLSSKEEKIKFVVKAPYYKRDTIVRNLKRGTFSEEVPLKVDDYALMIHIFSSSSLEDWEARREQLNNMIAADARIYQIFEKGNIGMEMYNKEEFINKLTVPLKSLRNIEIVETAYKGEQISVLRFMQKTEVSDD